MVDRISRKDLNELVSHRDGPCVSIFAKMEITGRETMQNPVRFRNMVNEARKALKQEGKDDSILKPLDTMIDDDVFWQYQAQGLAIFAAPNFVRHFRIGRPLRDRCFVSDRFEVMPLMPALFDGSFYLLSLSQHQVKLYDVSRFSIQQVDLGDTPTRLDDALWYDDREGSVQFHTKSTSVQGGPQPRPNRGGSHSGARPAMFYGTDQLDDFKEKQVKRFFQIIDDGVKEAIENEQKPMILAAQDFIHPIYKEVNSYARLDDKHGLRINPDSLKEEELHCRAWAQMEEVFREREQNMVARYHQLMGTGMTSNRIDEVISEAEKGRVDSIFVPDEEHIFGQVTEENGQTKVASEGEPNGVDLLNLAALKTLETDGIVYVVSRDQMPDQTPIAAVYRY